MKQVRIFLLTLAAIVIVAAATWLGYTLYVKFTRPVQSPFSAIPGNSALIIQLNRAGNLLEELNRSNLLWKAMSYFPGISAIKNELRYVDSASRKNDEISKILRQQQILISITLSGRSGFGALYLTNAGGISPESYIKDFITKVTEGKTIITESPYATTKIFRVQARGSREAFYFGIMKGLFIGSFHIDLVQRAIDRLLLNTPMATSAGFRRVEATSGKKADANLYVNYRFFSLVLSKLTQEKLLPDLIKFSSFADWSGLDLIIKKNELLFSGTTVASDSSQQFLSLFADQAPQKKMISSILPEQTLYFTAYGWSDPERFSRRYQNRTPREDAFAGMPTEVFSLVDRYQLNLNEYFLPWTGNEACLFVLENPVSQAKMHFSAFQSTDTARTLRLLGALADTIGINMDSVVMRGHKIYRMNLPAFMPALFGDLFLKVNVQCMTFYKGYVVFANNVKELEVVLQAWNEQAVMANDKSYLDFDEDLPEKANVYSYFNSNKAVRTLRSFLNNQLSDQVTMMMDSIRKFRAVAFQYGNSDGLFYSNIFLRYDPNLGREGPLLWQARLDTTIATRPVIFRTSGSGERHVVVADVTGILYMINSGGHLQWKKPLMGKLLGTIQTITLPGRDSANLIFNTDTHLYLLNADGTYADKYPMRFPLHATNEIKVFRDPETSEYRILVALQDNRIYSFSLDGMSVHEWKRPRMNEPVTSQVTVMNDNVKTYIVITDQAGNTQITDNTGKQSVSPEPKFTHAPASGFYMNRSPKKGKIVTTGPTGKIVFIQDNGRISEVTVNVFSPAHRFFYEDISGNGHPEFIFIDRNKIFYYDRNYKLTYSYEFRRDIATPPFLLHGKDRKAMIGFVVPETNEMFLFDRYGYYELGPGLKGNTPFEIGFLLSDTVMNLIAGSGKLLKNFKLPQH
jgi:hypothetical protein